MTTLARAKLSSLKDKIEAAEAAEAAKAAKAEKAKKPKLGAKVEIKNRKKKYG